MPQALCEADKVIKERNSKRGINVEQYWSILCVTEGIHVKMTEICPDLTPH